MGFELFHLHYKKLKIKKRPRKKKFTNVIIDSPKTKLLERSTSWHIVMDKNKCKERERTTRNLIAQKTCKSIHQFKVEEYRRFFVGFGGLLINKSLETQKDN